MTHWSHLSLCDGVSSIDITTLYCHNWAQYITFTHSKYQHNAALVTPRLVLLPTHQPQLLQSFLVAAQLEVQEILLDNGRDSGGGHTENTGRLVQDSLHRSAHFWKTASMSLTLMEVEPWSFIWDTGTSWFSPASRRRILGTGKAHHHHEH